MQSYSLSRKQKAFLYSVFSISLFLCVQEPAFASLESSLMGIKTKLTGFILPVLSVIGLVLAGISYLTGNPNAKTHLTYAILGVIFGFGAQAIVDFIAQTVH